MEETNYYLILELSVDPPETDPKVIEETIKKKQVEWSRLRSHPTRGIQAQKYIGLLQEIQRVMLDPALREEEAAKAKKLLEQKEQEKFTEIDRHINLLLAKGSITDQEVVKLSDIHQTPKAEVLKRVKRRQVVFEVEKQLDILIKKGDISGKEIARLAKQYHIAEEKIRERIHRKKEAIYADIDKYMSLCVQRGFITDREISRLALLYSIPDSEVRRRVKSPIIKKEPTKKTDKIKPMDKSIEKLIHENLKIVGKSSLYDFLEMDMNAPLEALQNRSKEKETEVRTVAQKDAVATASGILAGLCIAAFKSDETRKSYDLTRSLAPMAELDADIRLMATGGTLRSEYIDILIKSAIRMGVEIAHADDYINEFARKEKWTIEVSREKKQLRFRLAAAVAAIVIGVIFIAGSITWYRSNQVNKAYQRVLANVEEQPTLEEKERLLKDFIAYYSKTSYAQQAQQQVSILRKEMDRRDFEKASADAKVLEAENNLDGALMAYKLYLNKHPSDGYTSQAQSEFSRLSEILNNRDYEALKNTANQMAYDKRMEMYQEYIAKHPNSKHSAEVKQLIAETFNLLLTSLKKDLDACEQRDDWNQCIQMCSQFIEKYKDQEKIIEVKNIRASYENKIRRADDLAELRKKAQDKGEDWESAKQVWLDYLNANPESSSYIRSVIAKEVAEYDRKIQRRNQEKKDWESLNEYCNNSNNDIYKRFQRMEMYVSQNPNGTYISEAKSLLERLRAEKKEKDDRLKAEHEIAEWNKTVTYAKDIQNSLSDRLQMVSQFIKQFPDSKYSKPANELLAYLQQEKANQDARTRAEQERLARIQREKQSIRAQLPKTGGRFVEKVDGVLMDTKTGLMWCMVDSSVDMGTCLDFQNATSYVSRLNTGGFTNWRIPTASELVGIYKTAPFFPPSASKWYWSSDMFWHGWNKMVFIVTSSQETAWNKETMDLTQCGAVRAVR